MTNPLRSALSAVLLGISVSAWGKAPAQSTHVDDAGASSILTSLVLDKYAKMTGQQELPSRGISETRGGFEKFCRGETDLLLVPRPILKRETELCMNAATSFVELPLAFDALVVVANPRNKHIESLSMDDLRRIWTHRQGDNIVRWKQLDASWVDSPVALLGTNANQGTMEYFAASLGAETRALRQDMMVFADETAIVRGVLRLVNSIGLISYSQYSTRPAPLLAVPVAAQGGAPAVLPTPASIADGSYRPLAYPIFAYANAKSLQNRKKYEFLLFYVREAKDLATRAGWVALPEAVQKDNLNRLKRRKTGSAWGGKIATGLAPHEVQARQAKLR